MEASRKAKEEKEAAQRRQQVGLRTHEERRSSGCGGRLTGVLTHTIDGISKIVSRKQDKEWRLDSALGYLTTRPVLSGGQFRVTLGHLTMRALLHRGPYCVLQHSYRFATHLGPRKGRLWKAVAEEMTIFRLLTPFWVC